MPPSNEFLRPNFLETHGLATDPLYEADTGNEITGGGFVEIKHLPSGGLPREAKKKFPDGFVIKRYRNDRPSPSASFGSNVIDAWAERDADDRMVFGEIGLTLEQQRKILVNRDKKLRAYFGGELPDLLVKTSVFVGKDANGREIGLYELQPRMRGFVSPLRTRPHPRADVHPSDGRGVEDSVARMEGAEGWSWVIVWCRQVEEALRNGGIDARGIHELGREIRAFVRLAGEMSSQADETLHDRFLDIRGADNLIISRDGHLRLIDRNVLYDRSAPSARGIVYQEFQAMLQTLAKLAEHCENIQGIVMD